MILSILDWRLWASVLVSLLGYGLYQFLRFVLRPYLSPWRDIPGPPSKGLFKGNHHAVFHEAAGEAVDSWVAEYGNTIVWKMLLNEDRLMTFDAKANAHFLNRTDIYQRPKVVRRIFSALLGEGLLGAEGDDHKRQRRVLNPAFGQSQVNQLSGIFLAKAHELRERLDDVIAASQSRHPATESNTHYVEMYSWLAKATLDVIGLAGFDYSFDSLKSSADAPNELSQAFASLLRRAEVINMWTVLTTYVPILRILPVKQEREFAYAKSVMRRIGSQLITEKKAQILNSNTSGEVEKASIQDRDLLSLLIRANMAKDLPESQQLSDEEILGQIATFLAAGHDTTSSLLSWALYALSSRSDLQTRLRAELQTVTLYSPSSTDPVDQTTLNTLNALPLLDAVVRETLRIYSPVFGIGRTAMCDDVVELEKPFVDRKGVTRNHVVVPKGHSVIVPVFTMHRSTSIWGPDATEFNPDRWLGAGPPATASNISGVLSNLMSFSSGPRACIGWRFSVLEAKIFLHTLFTTFKFSPTGDRIFHRTTIVSRPELYGEKDKGPKLPLFVSRYED